MATSLTPMVEFLFEVGMLSNTPRTGFQFFGTNRGQNLAEHILRMMYICQVLCAMEPDADIAACFQMCLVHDLGEVRTGDLNYVYKQYVTADESGAVRDALANVPFGPELLEQYQRYEERVTLEAILVKEADNLELLLSLKERMALDDPRISAIVKDLVDRIRTESGKELARQIMESDLTHWWMNVQERQWARMREDGVSSSEESGL